MCRKRKKVNTNYLLRNDVNHIEKNVEDNDVKETINYIAFNNQWYSQVFDLSYDSSGDDYVAAIMSETAKKVEQPMYTQQVEL